MAYYLGRLTVGRELRRFGCDKAMRSQAVASSVVPYKSRGLNTTLSVSQSISSTKQSYSKNESSLRSKPNLTDESTQLQDTSRPDINLRFRYPEMFPEPFMIWRNPVKEKLERKDMLARRSRIYIPEFYVGSVLRVVLSNVHQPDKTSSFVGICIQREECGLKAQFILRNVVDNLGVELKLELYDPRLQKIEVLRLEKRLDTHLRYLRDAPPEYSTFPLDMKAEIRRTDEVPINRIKVKMNPRPWTENWFKYDFKGIDNIEEQITNKMRAQRESLIKPWEKYQKFDLMKTYRSTLPEEEIADILTEIKDDVEELERNHKKRVS